MASAVQICNRGLSSIGLRTITALTGSEKEAIQCNLHYQDNLETLLAEHPWVFATKRVVLAELATNARPDEWEYQYARPANMLDIKWVNDPGTARNRLLLGLVPTDPYEMAEQFIWSDVENACAEYVELIEDPSVMPPHFRNALSWMMAASLVLALTEDSNRVGYAEEKAAMAISKAKEHDANLTLDTETQPPMHLIERGSTDYASEIYPYPFESNYRRAGTT